MLNPGLVAGAGGCPDNAAAAGHAATADPDHCGHEGAAKVLVGRVREAVVLPMVAAAAAKDEGGSSLTCGGSI